MCGVVACSDLRGLFVHQHIAPPPPPHHNDEKDDDNDGASGYRAGPIVLHPTGVRLETADGAHFV